MKQPKLRLCKLNHRVRGKYLQFYKNQKLLVAWWGREIGWQLQRLRFRGTSPVGNFLCCVPSSAFRFIEKGQ